MSVCGPLLVTERFELWQPRTGDLAGLVRLFEGEDMVRHLGPARFDAQAQFDRLLRNAGCWSLYGYGAFIVRPGGEDEIVASCGVFHSWRGFGRGFDDMPEAGWIVRQDHWRQGIAGEVMRKAIAWFDETHGASRVVCMIETGNLASERLAAGLGFVRYDRHEQVEQGRTATLDLYERVC